MSREYPEANGAGKSGRVQVNACDESVFTQVGIAHAVGAEKRQTTYRSEGKRSVSVQQFVPNAGRNHKRIRPGVPSKALAEPEVQTGRLHRVLEEWFPTLTGHHAHYETRRQSSLEVRLVIAALRVG